MFEYVSKLIDLSWPNFSSITWNATNADCRLAGHNEVNIVVECSNRFPIPNLDFLNDLNLRDRDSVKTFHEKVFIV